jgi:TatD DNase family protein
MQEYVDAHCHINFLKKPGDVALICEKQRVHTIYVTTLPSHFEATYDYVKSLTYIYPAIGFHALEYNYNLENERNIFLRNIDKTQYIGEVGLDFSKNSKVPKSQQIDNFEFILEAIKGKNKLLSVHSRDAEDEVLDLLLYYNIEKVIFHWYTGKISTLKKAVKYGYYFSINQAMIKSQKGQNIVSKLPLELVLTETDAPFIRNVLPYDNKIVYTYLQELWGKSQQDTQSIILNNFNNLKKKKYSLFEVDI